MYKNILLLLFLLAFSGNADSQYIYKDAFPNLSFAYPTELVHPGDSTNRLFVLEKNGRVMVFNNNPSVSSAKVFLDLTDRVSNTTYAGLFGIAFHPAYINNGYFYLYYMTGSTAAQVLNLVRFSVSETNPDSALKSSEYVLMTVPAPNSFHNGSSIRFGPDGYLYFGFGDSSPGSGGDPFNKAQNRAEIFGKMNRINVDSVSEGRNYAIPQSNPYYQNTLGYREEIFAYGFRNMWKFCFDNLTGKIWLADVGQVRWEEINIVESGKNYGWRRKEALECYNPSSGCDTAGFDPEPPLFYYGHGSGNTSITGGYIYRGSKLPGLYGKYIYSDYTSGRIWVLTWDGINPPSNAELFDAPFNIVSYGEDKDKNLYFLSYNSTAGKIYTIVDTTLTNVTNSTGIPDGFELLQNYPNPFNPQTTVRYSIPVASVVKIILYDVRGNEVLTMLNESKEAGDHEFTFNASGLSSGIYYYKMFAGKFEMTKKFVLMK